MKISVTKYGETLIPADDIQAELFKKFTDGCMYEIDIKLTRNPRFHRKGFALFQFFFNYWVDDFTDHKFKSIEKTI